MSKFFSIVFVVCALVAAVNSSGYGAPAILNANSYSLGPSHLGYGLSPHILGAYGRPGYSAQPLLSQEIYPGRNLYRSYHSVPTYSQIALPIVRSAPLAKLYGSHGYGGSIY